MMFWHCAHHAGFFSNIKFWQAGRGNLEASNLFDLGCRLKVTVLWDEGDMSEEVDRVSAQVSGRVSGEVRSL
jgi:hypothetical protein